MITSVLWRKLLYLMFFAFLFMPLYLFMNLMGMLYVTRSALNWLAFLVLGVAFISVLFASKSKLGVFIVLGYLLAQVIDFYCNVSGLHGVVVYSVLIVFFWFCLANDKSILELIISQLL